MVSLRFGGKSYPSLAAFHSEVGHRSVSSNAFYQRLHTGWSRKEAAMTPLKKQHRNHRRAKRR